MINHVGQSPDNIGDSLRGVSSVEPGGSHEQLLASSQHALKQVSTSYVHPRARMSQPHTLTAAPKTDFWRKPPSLDTANAPTQLTRISSRSFTRARVTVRARWERLYDQGGFFIVFPSGRSSGTASRGDAGASGAVDVAGRFWMKAGMEFFHGRPNISVVASREWSDWSLTPLSGGGPEAEVTLEVEREPIDTAEGKGSSLFVYVVRDGVRDEIPIREVTWAFEKEGEMQVGTYAARPTALKDGDDEQLEVHFEGLRCE